MKTIPSQRGQAGCTKRHAGDDRSQRARLGRISVSGRFWSFLGVLIIGLFCLQELLAIPRLSATSDEPMHLVAGYSYWHTRDFRINPEHPPLAKLIAAIPLLFIKPALDTSGEDWKTASEDQLGLTFLYSNDADRLLFWARTLMVALGALGGLVAFLWARELFGPMAGAFAAGLYGFCPNLLAHGMLITTDVPVGSFSLLTLYLFWRQGRRPTWQNSIVTGLALGAAMTTKFSGGLLPILIAALACVRALRQKNRNEAFVAEIKSLAVMAVASLFVIEAAYLFSASPLLYFKNSSAVNANHQRGYQYYMLGELRPGGWWYYFLVAFAFKATIASLILIALAAAQMISGRRNAWSDIVLVGSIIFYFVAYSVGADNVGVRYVLPVFPFIYVWVSGVVPSYSANRLGCAVLVILLGWQIGAAVSSYPNYIPYFNEFAGGSRGGPDILDDSNVDWGQSLKQAAAYVKNKRIENVILCPFSQADNPQYYRLTFPVSPPGALVFKTPRAGTTYIISGHNLAWMKAVDPMWRQYQPVDQVGGMWVYRF